MELAPELGARRLGLMDEAGITLQVLSNTGPGPDLVPGPEGVALASAFNDYLAEAVGRPPDRFAGFAALPRQSPGCAPEAPPWVRSTSWANGALINGTTEGRFSTTRYDGLLAAAAELHVPIYIHPHLRRSRCGRPTTPDLPAGAGRVLETATWGWHSETAIHLLRLVMAGTLDRHPRLKLIIGHMGECSPSCSPASTRPWRPTPPTWQRPISRAILDQVWITTSGIFTEPPFLAALLTFGIDRIMFSVDYPYARNMKGRAFLDRIALSPTDMAKLCHGNADALLKLKAE